MAAPNIDIKPLADASQVLQISLIEMEIRWSIGKRRYNIRDTQVPVRWEVWIDSWAHPVGGVVLPMNEFNEAQPLGVSKGRDMRTTLPTLIRTTL
jgi:hypothetical protein